MRDILQYFDLIVRVVEISSAVSSEIELDQLDARRGTLNGVLYFADGSRLEFTERVVIERSKPIKRGYRYQYVQAQATTFRYDNAPHHPLLSNFPHHKHLGRKTIEAREPSLKEVIEEVETLLTEEPSPAHQVTTRRRQSKTGKTNRR